MNRSRVLDDAIFQTILPIALFENPRLKLFKRFLRHHRAVKVSCVWVKRFGDCDHRGRNSRPVKSRRARNNALKVLRISLRLHHRLTSSSRAADEIAMGGIRALVAANQDLAPLCCPAYAQMTEVDLRFSLVEGPARHVSKFGLVPGVGA